MSRFATDSDNDSDDSSNTKCFAINPVNFFKRSTYVGVMRDIQQHHLSPGNVFSGARQLSPHYEAKTMRNTTIGEFETEPFDPTYGFARFATANNVYFQSAASPNNCHMSPPSQHLLSTPSTTPAMFQDVLFPLRTSAESKTSGHNLGQPSAAKPTRTNCGPYAVNRKRVKFNEIISSNSISSPTIVGRPPNYQYSNEKNENCRSNGFAFSDPSTGPGQQQLSLRQRLANFFSSFF